MSKSHILALCFILLNTFFQLSLQAQNIPPIAVADSASTSSGNSVMVLNFMSNDYDPNGNNISLDTVLNPVHGSFVFLNTSSEDLIQYTADSTFSGLDSMAYVICDDGSPAACDTGWIIIDVTYWQFEAFALLDINDISARINAGGNHFWDLGLHAGFEVPKGSGNHASFSAALWLAGMDGSGQLHATADMHANDLRDWVPGPHRDNAFFQAADSNYNYVWKLHRSEIEYHILHWEDPGYTAPNAIATWPGNGNTALGEADQLAAYHDCNGNGVYEPQMGEYPLILGDQAVLSIFCDGGMWHNNSGGIPIGAEVHCMAYGFDRPNDPVLNQTIFFNYKIFNRSTTSLYDCRLGQYLDNDLGYAFDDYNGCDVEHGLFYTYNADDFDEDYGMNPPALGMQMLAGPLLSPDASDNPVGVGAGESINGYGFGDGTPDNERSGLAGFHSFQSIGSAMGIPQVDTEFNNYLNGYWRDGTPLFYGGIGYYNDPSANDTIPAHFMYPNNSDSLGFGTGIPNLATWTETTSNNMPGDRGGVGITGPFDFEAGEMVEMDVAFIYARGTNGAASSMQRLIGRADSIRTVFNDSLVEQYNTYSCVPAQVENGPIQPVFRAWPNPTAGALQLRYPASDGAVHCEVLNLLGQQMSAALLNPAGNDQIELNGLTPGVYFVRIHSEAASHTIKVVLKR